MNNITRYINGMMIGMCGEYIYRVEASIWPILIVIGLSFSLVLDLIITRYDKNK